MRSLDEYQLAVSRFDPPPENRDLRLACHGLGIAGEAGEVADLLKKHLGHGHFLDKEKLTLELGDVLWYVAAIARMHGIPLSVVAKRNDQKLTQRYPNGFCSQDSINRVEDE